MYSFLVRPLRVILYLPVSKCNSSNLNTAQDMYKFSDKMSNGNGLEGLTC